MRPPGIKVTYPLLENSAKVIAGDGNQVIQTLPTSRADRSLADSIRHRCANRSFQYSEAEMPDRAIQFIPKLAVPVSNQETVAVIARYRLAKLVKSPITARMCGDIDVDDFTCRMFDDDEHIQDFEAGGDDSEEIAGQA